MHFTACTDVMALAAARFITLSLLYVAASIAAAALGAPVNAGGAQQMSLDVWLHRVQPFEDT